MTRALLPVTLLSAVILSGCTIPIKLAYSETCSTEATIGYVGQPYTDRIGRIIKDKSQSMHVRVLAPDTMVTQEFREKRVNIALNEKNRIARIYCG
jgi:hypothetical protein